MHGYQREVMRYQQSKETRFEKLASQVSLLAAEELAAESSSTDEGSDSPSQSLELPTGSSPSTRKNSIEELGSSHQPARARHDAWLRDETHFCR